MVDGNCAKCKYSALMPNEQYCCVYILIEQHMRGCYEGKCDKFCPRKGRKKHKITWRYTVYEEE